MIINLFKPSQVSTARYLSITVSITKKVSYDHTCSAQTRTGIGLLGKPPAVKQFHTVKSHWAYVPPTQPGANAGMKRTSVVEHNLYFARLMIVG